MEVIVQQGDLLLIEDDEHKKTNIINLLDDSSFDFEICVAASLMSGVRSIKKRSFDLVLLDMTLPNYDVIDGETGGGMHAFGGVEFLKQMRRFKIDTPVIVITQFETFGQPPNLKDLPELDMELSEAFSPTYKGAIYYHASIDDWSEQIIRKIQEI